MRICWRMRLVEGLIYGIDGAASEGSSSESFQNTQGNIKTSEQAVSNWNIENKRKEMNDASETIVTRNGPRREAAVIGDIKRRFVVGEFIFCLVV